LIERAAIISYLHAHPDKTNVWKNGWKFNQRPKLKTMLETMSNNADLKIAEQICETFGHIIHGDPLGSEWNMVHLDEGGLGYSVGKSINDPELCDFICFQSYLYLVVLMGMMVDCFPSAPIKKY
jgi:hypothetical protein